MKSAPRPLVFALEQCLAETDGCTVHEFRRRYSKRVAAIHALGAALDDLGSDELGICLRAAIGEYLTAGGDDD